MNYEELAFVNQQLAGMLKSGIPLEGALRGLCAGMKRGRFRTQLEALEADLAKGVPLREALAARQLPEFYVKMIQAGAPTHDLPGILTLVADYYQRAHVGWTRLKGLLVYPVIVLAASLGLSAFVAVICTTIVSGNVGLFNALIGSEIEGMLVAMWTPAVGLLVVSLAVALALLVPAFRRALRWWLPGFKEHSLTHFASAMNLMLSSGTHLGEALDLAERLETGSPAGAELRQWKRRLAEGNAKIADLAKDSKVFPPLFVWLLAQGGEDLAAGFKKAAEIYFARATSRIELLLYVALPVSVLVVGVMILGQFFPLFRLLTSMIDMLGDTGG
jgi:type II secretory pathway component PulF